jgi:UDP-N-acetylmuramoylalanine--D-glutamate ligase
MRGTVVVGMARSGLAVARLLRSKGMEVWATDRNPAPALAVEFEAAGIAYETGNHSVERFRSAEEIVVSPGVPLDIPALEAAREAGVGIVGELEVSSRYVRGSIVAVTGSNGKTTTTALTGHVLEKAGLKVQVGGNIGRPLADMVAGSTEDTVNVLEVSSFQIDTTRAFRPHVAVVLNITPDHLDRYRDFDAYRESKMRLFRNQDDADFAVVNMDDPNVFPFRRAVGSRIRTFTRRRRVTAGGGFAHGWLTIDGRRVVEAASLQLRGAHNIENVLAALLAANAYGVADDEAAAAAAAFQPVEHRIETVARIDGVEFVNDSKATNVDSAVKAIESFAEPLVLILGGKDKGAPYDPLVGAMKGRVTHAVLLGEAADKIGRAIGESVPTSRAGSMSEAVGVAIAHVRPGHVVLLSPACASFDMYANYEERGRDFKRVVLSGRGMTDAG